MSYSKTYHSISTLNNIEVMDFLLLMISGRLDQGVKLESLDQQVGVDAIKAHPSDAYGYPLVNGGLMMVNDG